MIINCSKEWKLEDYLRCYHYCNNAVLSNIQIMIFGQGKSAIQEKRGKGMSLDMPLLLLTCEHNDILNNNTANTGLIVKIYIFWFHIYYC